MSAPRDLRTIVERAVHASDAEESSGIYRSWADDYDADVAATGYVAPRVAVGMLVDRLPDRSVRILDAGCGTGLVGAALIDQGYVRIDGGDYSAEMLRKAEAKGVYQQLSVIDLSTAVPIDTATYDAVISVGVFAPFMASTYLPELLRVLRPGGVLVASIRPGFFADHIEGDVADLERSGVIVDVATTVEPSITGTEAAADSVYLALTTT